MGDAQLKPCPFCGGPAEWKSGGPGCAWISCKQCPAETGDGSIQRVKDAWNRRADIAALQSQARESALEALSAYGQAQDAYAAQLKAEAKLRDAIVEGMRIATLAPIEMVTEAIEDALRKLTGATP